MNVFQEMNCGLTLLFYRSADCEGAAANAVVWQDTVLRTLTSGRGLFMELLHIHTLFDMQKLDIPNSILDTAGISFETALNMKYEHESSLIWDTDGCRHGGDFLGHPTTVGKLFQLLCFLVDPHGLSPSEMMECIPEPSTCPFLEDRMHSIFAQSEPAGVLLAKTALELGLLFASFLDSIICYGHVLWFR
jgi:hypothetical protein